MIRPCMTVEEYRGWLKANQVLGSPAVTPCVDCPVSFALEMREIDKCNGEPGGTLLSSVTDIRRRQWREAKRRSYARARTIDVPGLRSTA